MKNLVCALVVFSLIFPIACWAQTRPSPAKQPLHDFDIREQRTATISADQPRADALVERRTAGLASFASTAGQGPVGTRIVVNEYGLPKLYFRDGRALSAPSTVKPSEIAKEFLRAQPEIFALAAREVDQLRLAVDDVTENAKFIAFNQTLNGIDVFNAQIKFTLSKNGEVVQVSMGDVVPGLNISTAPQLTPDEAVKAAFAAIGQPVPNALSRTSDANGKPAFSNPHGQKYNPITAELSIFPTTAVSARLAYRIFLEVDLKSWYELLIDANDGALLFRHNLYVLAGQARVWTESPSTGTRSLFNIPEGWLAADATQTTGNNVDAFLDANGNDQPDQVTNSNMKDGRAYSATQVFDFEFGDGTVQLDPRLYQPAAVTNLFYFVNTAHDYFYGLGFNEAAGNFQTNNFGRGGVGNDAVIAEAQNAAFTDNAAFAPTVEGTAPRLRMGLVTKGTSSRTDDLDTDYDGMIVVHEYGHGVSNRLVGSRTSTSCLARIQSGALGEGWSDYFASSFFNNPVEAGYFSQNSTTGIRRYSYEFYPLTYEDFGNGDFGYEFHDDGEIWTGTLWDLRKSLGAALTDRLVIDGLKSTPCNPSMTDARDGILTADVAANSGANRRMIWTVFARHGFGYSSAGFDGTLLTGTRYDASFDLPPDLTPARNPLISSDPLTLHTGFGDAYRYAINVSNPAGGVLNFGLADGPSGMTVSSTGTVSWTAGFATPRVKIIITDGKGGEVVHGYALPVLTTLTSGNTINISGNFASTGFAVISVPASTPVLQVKMRGGTGDADLWAVSPLGSFGLSARDGNTETLSFAEPRAGQWLIEVDGYSPYAGAALTAALITPAPLTATSSLTGLTGDFTSESFYRISVPPGLATLTITTSGGTGDVDILLRKDSPAVCQPFPEAFVSCQYSQYSAGDGNAESITATNPGAGNWYLDLIGYEAYTGVKLDITSTYPPLSLATNGAATTFTPGTNSVIATGYATATLNGGAAPYATAVFSLSQNGVVVSEAGVPASPPVQSARIFIDYRTGVASGTRTIDILTGLAVANPGANSASVTYTLRDRAGLVLATGHGTINAGAHWAKFIHQLRDVAPDFNLPTNFPTATLFGSLEISSSQPVSVLGLRLTTNQRGETLLTSTSVADLSRPATSTPIYFPQIADGGGYITSLVLSNTTGSTQTGNISVLDDNGAPLSVRPVGGNAGTTFPYSIPSGGTFVFQTDGSPSAARVGWATVTPTGSSTTPVGAGVFSFSPAGILVTESGVPSAALSSRARIFVDKSNNHDTGLAIGNPGSSAINITVQAFQTSGTSVASPATLTIPANGHKAAFIGQVITGLPNGFTGVADITASSPFAPLTLRSLNNSRGDFLLTTFPAPDVSQPGPTPIVFPQIADGAGYRTQFIFISATGTASVNVNFIGDDGALLNIGRTQ